MFDRAAVGIGALVGLVAQELVKQIAVGRMDLDAVETGCFGIDCRAAVLLDDARDLGRFQGARCHHRYEAIIGIGLTLRLDGRRRHRQCATELDRGMRDAPDVPQLQEDFTAGRMHRIGNVLPGVHLRVAINARRKDIPLALRGNLGGFGDDQSGAGALHVVFGRQITGDVIFLGAATCERRHDDPIAQFERTELHWLEQVA